MSGSRWAVVVDAVIDLLDTELDATVYDGIPVTSDPLTDAVIVGNQPGNDDGYAGKVMQEYHEVGPTAKRDERGEIRCSAIAQSGDSDLSTVRTTAFTTVAAVESALRDSVALGLADLLRVELMLGDISQGATPRGVFCEVRFVLSYTALI